MTVRQIHSNNVNHAEKEVLKPRQVRHQHLQSLALEMKASSFFLNPSLLLAVTLFGLLSNIFPLLFSSIHSNLAVNSSSSTVYLWISIDCPRSRKTASRPGAATTSTQNEVSPTYLKSRFDNSPMGTPTVNPRNKS